MLARMVLRSQVCMSLTAVVLVAGCGDAGPAASDPPTRSDSSTRSAPVAVTGASTTRSVATRPTEVLVGSVVYVSDGDTIGVQLAGVVTRIRLIGINAPESKDPNLTPQCYGPQAAALVRALLPRRTRVRVVTDPTQDRIDRYRRLLAYIQPERGGVTFNEAIVRAGAARVYVYRRKHPPRLLTRLRAAERDARAAGRGLWTACPAK